MTTTTAKVTRNGLPSKLVHGAINYKGYLVKVHQKGIGVPTEKGGLNSYGEGDTWEEYDSYEDVYIPAFNTTLVTKNDYDLKKFMKEIDLVDIRKIIGTENESMLVKWGNNEGDLLVEDRDALLMKETEAKKEVNFTRHDCWETGFEFYQLAGRYPAEVFAAMKPELQYHSEEIEEEGNWKGWYTHDTDAVNALLNKIGWSIKKPFRS